MKICNQDISELLVLSNLGTQLLTSVAQVSASMWYSYKGNLSFSGLQIWIKLRRRNKCININNTSLIYM